MNTETSNIQEYEGFKVGDSITTTEILKSFDAPGAKDRTQYQYVLHTVTGNTYTIENVRQWQQENNFKA